MVPEMPRPSRKKEMRCVLNMLYAISNSVTNGLYVLLFVKKVSLEIIACKASFRRELATSSNDAAESL